MGKNVTGGREKIIRPSAKIPNKLGESKVVNEHMVF